MDTVVFVAIFIAPEDVFIVTAASPTLISSAADEPLPEFAVHDKFPEPSVFNTCPDVPSAVGKVNEVPLFNVLAYTIPCICASLKLFAVEPKSTPLSSAGKIPVVSALPNVITFDDTLTSDKSFNEDAPPPEPFATHDKFPEPSVFNT